MPSQSIILGIGTGRCGLASLAKILNQQPDAVCSFDEPPLLPWNLTPSPLAALPTNLRSVPGEGDRVRIIKERFARFRLHGKARLLGDCASFYLPYLQDAIAQEPDNGSGWDSGGTGHASASGDSKYSYSAETDEGAYEVVLSSEGNVGHLSGKWSESGNGNDTYSSDASYTWENGNWQTSSTSADASGDSLSKSGYSADGSYSRTFGYGDDRLSGNINISSEDKTTSEYSAHDGSTSSGTASTTLHHSTSYSFDGKVTSKESDGGWSRDGGEYAYWIDHNFEVNGTEKGSGESHTDDVSNWTFSGGNWEKGEGDYSEGRSDDYSFTFDTKRKSEASQYDDYLEHFPSVCDIDIDTSSTKQTEHWEDVVNYPETCNGESTYYEYTRTLSASGSDEDPHAGSNVWTIRITPSLGMPPCGPEGGSHPFMMSAGLPGGELESSSGVLGVIQVAGGSSSSVGLAEAAGATRLAYDDAGNLTSLTDANANTTHFTYNGAGNLASLSDPNGNTTSWLYDSSNRVTQETDILGASRYFTYDSVGNLNRYSDRNGQIRQYGYDTAGNLASETWYANSDDADAQQNAVNTIGIERDDAGRIVAESDDLTSVVYVYNDAGQITSTTQSSVGGPTVTLDYQYDTAGHRTQMAATIDSVADFVDDYSYDSLGRVVSVVEHGVTGGNAVALKEIDLAYNDAGQIVSIDRYENGQLAVEGDYSYDSLGRLAALVYHQGETVLNSYAWTYSGDSARRQSVAVSAPWSPTGGLMPVHDTSGITDSLMSGGFAGVSLLTSVTSNDGTASYSYDPTGELVGASYDNSALQQRILHLRCQRKPRDGQRKHVHDGADNRLLSDGVYRYEYDGEGNRTARFIDNNPDGVLDAGDTDIAEYTWDARERLIEVKDYATFGGDPTQIVDYLYDVENRWVGENIDLDGDGQVDRRIRFAYDGNQIVLQFEKDGDGAVTGADLSHRYLWEPNVVDQLMADEQVTNPETPGTVVWPLADNLGTIRDLAVMDAQIGVTSVANHRVYDSFGNLKSQTNAAVDCLFGFTGRPIDNATGLQNNLNRWYDAKTGCWMSKDPIGFEGRDANQYRYVGNSPTAFTDPTGLEPFGGLDTVTFTWSVSSIGVNGHSSSWVPPASPKPKLAPPQSPDSADPWRALGKARSIGADHSHDTATAVVAERYVQETMDGVARGENRFMASARAWYRPGGPFNQLKFFPSQSQVPSAPPPPPPPINGSP